MVITNQTDFPLISIEKSNHKLESVQKVKILGVFIDNKMEFLHHSVYIASKVSRSIGIIYRVEDILPHFVFQQIYRSSIFTVFQLLHHCMGRHF